jgi:hypothetical protein
VARVRLELTAFLGLSQDGLPIAYLALSVSLAGFEPAHLTITGSQPMAATNYATGTFICNIYSRCFRLDTLTTGQQREKTHNSKQNYKKLRPILRRHLLTFTSLQDFFIPVERPAHNQFLSPSTKKAS